jgi:hypothetical protein
MTTKGSTLHVFSAGRLLAAALVTMGLLAALAVLPGRTFAAANDEHASCMGLGSSFYGLFAPGQRADVAHLVKDSFAQAPGEHYRMFAQEKEGGSIPSPCGTRIE